LMHILSASHEMQRPDRNMLLELLIWIFFKYLPY
jgi:hypothetical protein